MYMYMYIHVNMVYRECVLMYRHGVVSCLASKVYIGKLSAMGENG